MPQPKLGFNPEQRPMKRSVAVVAAVALPVTLGFVWWFSVPDPPAYQGISAARWLSRLDEHGPTQDEARGAFQAMGADAVPWLSKGLNSPKAAPWLRWKFDFERLPGKQKILTMTAATALGAVGPPATNAIPGLVRLSQHEDYWVRSRAKAALLTIRGENLDHMQAELASVGRTGKWNDLPQVLIGLGPAAKPLVPTLVTLLDNTNPSTMGGSADILAELRLLPEIAVPALAKNLSLPDDNVRLSAAMALHQYGSKARPASEALIRALNDKWGYVAHNALLTIEQFSEAPEAANAVPVMRQLLSHPDDFIRKSARRILDKVQSAKRP